MPEPTPQDQMARMIAGYWVSQMVYVPAKIGLSVIEGVVSRPR